MMVLRAVAMTTLSVRTRFFMGRPLLWLESLGSGASDPWSVSSWYWMRWFPVILTGQTPDDHS